MEARREAQTPLVESFEEKIRRVIKYQWDGHRSPDCHGLEALLWEFHRKDPDGLLRFAVGEPGGDSLASFAITFAEEDKCSCLDVIRAFDNGRLFGHMRHKRVPLYSGGPPVHSLEEIAHHVGHPQCFPRPSRPASAP